MARTYRSPAREQQAEETKVRICLAAAPLFATQGYAATSMRQLATAAGVSMDTMYSLGSKSDVFLRALEMTLSGLTDGTPLFDRPDLASPPPGATLRDVVEDVVAAVVGANRRAVGLWTAFLEGANTDAALAAAFAQRIADMRSEGIKLFQRFVDWGLCPAPVDLVRTVDLGWTASHPSTYTLMVTHAGWTPAQYQEWLVERYLELLRG
ncbi:TetR family transcriptional regulator [Cryptosporangium sp. NPDC048952]|uniref:TetR family transcriptional regulator n=1 Tax=Cryptosporangium sp. NPDC048952 TaxID=3363961 RepID=UPI003710805A